MTSPNTEPAGSTSQPKAESFVDWFHINSKLIGAGALVVALLLAGYWFMERTKLNETISSDRQLLMAKQSLSTGNEQLALADLKKVMDKYGDKPAGAEAGMIIATTQMEKGDNKAALATLKDLSGKAKGASVAPVRALLGDALSQAGQPAEAAAEYEAAAAATSMPLERTSYQARAARAYLAAGKSAEAKKLFETIANQDEFPALSTEARMRLGELSVASKP